MAVAKLGAIFLPDLLRLRRRRDRRAPRGRRRQGAAVRRRLLRAGASGPDARDGRARPSPRSTRSRPSWWCPASARSADVPIDGRVADAAAGPSPARDRRARRPRVAVDSEHPLFIAYTSGTTGTPEGRRSHVHGGFTVKIAEEVAFQFDCRPGDRLFWFADFGWIMGPWEIVGTPGQRRHRVPLRGRARLPRARPAVGASSSATR